MKKPLFDLGAVAATRASMRLCQDNDIDDIALLNRHAAGDWGDLSEADKKQNDYSVTRALRILSAYDTPAGTIWIITEADRSSTSIILPEEY